MKKLIMSAVFGIAALAAFAGTCTVTHISLVSTDGSHKTFAGQLDNTSGVNILQHNFVVAFLDSSNNVLQTTTVSGCLRSVQNGKSGFFSATSIASSATVQTGLARIAFDSSFKVGTTSSQDVTISAVTAGRSGTTLTVKGTVKNNASATLYQPNACIVVRTSAGNVLITGLNTSLADLAQNASTTFTSTITVPNDSTAYSVDVWVDGLDSSNNPTTPQSSTGTTVNTGGTADHLAFSTQPVGGVVINTNFTTQPVVKIVDINGVTVTSGTDATKTVTLAVKSGTGPSGSVLTCNSNTVTAVAGLATFAGCKLNHAGTGIVLTATASSVTSADSNSVSITPGAADHLAFTTNPAGANGGSAFGTQPVVTVMDANGDTVWTGTNSTASVTLTASGGTFSCTTNPVVAVAGVATFAGCKINEAAAGYTLTAAASGLTDGTSGTFTVSVGAAATLAFTTQPAGSGTGVLATQPVVTVVDAGGNPVVSGVPVLTITSGTGAITGCVGTNTGGTVTYTGCSISTTGAKTLTATLGSATIASSSFTI